MIKKIKTNIRHQDQETNLLNKPISPRRLREGGAAILQALSKNHHIDILGIKLIKPLLTHLNTNFLCKLSSLMPSNSTKVLLPITLVRGILVSVSPIS